MRRIKNGLLLLFFALMLLSIIGLALPSTFKVYRAVRISNSATGVYPYLSALRNWPDWSIINKKNDATVLYSFSGPDRGIGCTMNFDGEKIGNGTIVFTDSERDHSISFDAVLNNEKVVFHGVILLEPKENGTDVSITLNGDVGLNLANRYVILFMDQVMGSILEENLQNLKALAE
jgi:hypothetical protein